MKKFLIYENSSFIVEKKNEGKSSRNSEKEEKLVFVSANWSERNQCESKMMTIWQEQKIIRGKYIQKEIKNKAEDVIVFKNFMAFPLSPAIV